MARISAPQWYSPPIAKWVKCRVTSELKPQGLLVEVELDGQRRSIVAPYSAVRGFGDNLPADGELFVVVVAELPDEANRLLTELPATPINGSQRLKVDRAVLNVA